eukprot:290870_1
MCMPIQINLPDCLDLSKKCHTVFIGTSCATLCGDMDIIECEFRSVCGDTANCNICKCRTFTPSNSPSKYPSEFPSKYPSKYPSISPSKYPSKYPSISPSKYPSKY